MIDVEVPMSDNPEVPDRIIDVPCVKGKDSFKVNISMFPDVTYDELVYLGVKSLLNRGQSDITTSKFPDEEERVEQAIEIAKKTLADMYAGKVRRTSGAKSTKGGKGEFAVECRRLATIYVREQLKDEGFRVSLIKTEVINKLRDELIETDPSIMEEAKANVAARKSKKVKKIDLSKVAEDDELVEKAAKKGRGRKKEDEEEVTAPPPARGRPGQRLNA